jgi:hypothetical protein
MVISCNINIWSFLLNQQSFNAAIQTIIQSHVVWRDCCKSQDIQSWQTWRLQDCWSKTKMFCEVKEVHRTYSHTCIIVWLELSMFESLHVTLYIYIYMSILSNHIISNQIISYHIISCYMYILSICIFIFYTYHIDHMSIPSSFPRRSSDGPPSRCNSIAWCFSSRSSGRKDPKGSERKAQPDLDTQTEMTWLWVKTLVPKRYPIK